MNTLNAILILRLQMLRRTYDYHDPALGAGKFFELQVVLVTTVHDNCKVQTSSAQTKVLDLFSEISGPAVNVVSNVLNLSLS